MSVHQIQPGLARAGAHVARQPDGVHPLGCRSRASQSGCRRAHAPVSGQSALAVLPRVTAGSKLMNMKGFLRMQSPSHRRALDHSR